eukprot:TRINITY_DN37220_c0_g1_i1.p1 TRINITY_DN37220_c0_g1~~TRINITY_DN37220_c0_g1_i1.p1  ORF type:complete len:511 (+),score=127.35 TRINITY_DN37220_c0_g1_i1:63-1535(+)
MKAAKMLSLLAVSAQAAQLPNLILMLGDDVGYYNMGFTENNPEAYSPNMDELAAGGVQLRRHYVYKYCSPTRSSMMTGRLPIHVNQQNPGESGGGVDLRFTMLPAKLKEAGYSTHHVGKWHLGATFIENVPVKRGFDTSIGYLQGSEDHFTQKTPAGIDLFENLEPAYGQNGTYGAYIYTTEISKLVDNHDKSKPFFLYAAYQNTHFPYEVPDSYLNSSIDPTRRTYQAMVRVLDESIGNLTAALKRNDMWDNTLMIYSADNGGASAIEGCASNNYPLRGSKHTDYEGGVRVGAFAAGGLIPQEMAGKKIEGYIHVADWYATFSKLAGLDPEDNQQGVPDIDSLDVFDLITGKNATSPRTEIPLSVNHENILGFPTGQGLIQGEWKYVVGNENAGIWMSPTYPNSSTECGNFHDPGCPNGCLFNIINDPTERHDLSQSQPQIFNQLKTRLSEIAKTVFQTGWPANYTQNCTDQATVTAAHQGFLFPRCTL